MSPPRTIKINKFIKIAGYKISIQKSIEFLYTSIFSQKEKVLKNCFV